MGEISKLLKWSKPVVLKDDRGIPVKDVWIRILDDDDLQDAYRDARIASATLRAKLKDTSTKEYLDDIAKIESATKEETILIIKAASGSNLTAEAFSNVVRPELPRIEEVAADPDAPTLEEQEKLDALYEKVNKEYSDAIDEYVEVRQAEIQTELEAKDLEVLIVEAKEASTSLIALSAFVSRVLDEKIWRGTYLDAKLTKHGFDDYADFFSSDSSIKDQLRDAYNSFELNPEEVKN